MVSKSLINFHQEICPDLPIDSIEFTNFLISEISKLKKEIKIESQDPLSVSHQSRGLPPRDEEG